MATKLKPTAVTVEVCLELSNYLKSVWIERYSLHGGMMYITLEKGEKIQVAYRLYSECKEAFMKFPSKVRISAKLGRQQAF